MERIQGRFHLHGDLSQWNLFLECHPLGHFQQASLWAQAKESEGWRVVRVGLQNGEGLKGGFQMLTRRSRLGQIAYITKGPVLDYTVHEQLDAGLNMIKSATVTEGIRAVVVQPPDSAPVDSTAFIAHGFLPVRFLSLMSATLVIDVSCSMETVVSRMRRTSRLELKRAEKRGVSVREGGEAELEAFFRLMVETCKRQQTEPSPGSVEVLRRIWHVFKKENRIRLNLAECNGEVIAGSISLCFGDRVTFWKKGWSGAHRDKHPNQMVMYDAIQWAQRNGFKAFDCLAMTRSTAESLLKGIELTDEQKRGRDFFLLGYGGTPVLFPEPWIYIPNPLLRMAYRSALRFPRLLSAAKGFLKAA